MPTVARKDVLPEGSVFYSMFETINHETFFGGANRKRLVLNTLEEFRHHTEGKVAQFGHIALDERYIVIAGLEDNREYYSKWMQAAHTSLAGTINRLEKRKGHVGCRRPTTHPAEDEECLMKLMFACDYLAVKLSLVDSPEQFKHSAYHYYARGKKLPWTEEITRPAFYERLGDTDKERQRAYRKLGRKYYEQGLLDEYIKAMLKGRPVGSEKYRRERSNFLAEVSRRERLKRAGANLFDASVAYALCPTGPRVLKFLKAIEDLVTEVVAPGPDPPRVPR